MCQRLCFGKELFTTLIRVNAYEELFSKTWSPNTALALQRQFLDWRLTCFGKELFKLIFCSLDLLKFGLTTSCFLPGPTAREVDTLYTRLSRLVNRVLLLSQSLIWTLSYLFIIYSLFKHLRLWRIKCKWSIQSSLNIHHIKGIAELINAQQNCCT